MSPRVMLLAVTLVLASACKREGFDETTGGPGTPDGGDDTTPGDQDQSGTDPATPSDADAPPPTYTLAFTHVPSSAIAGTTIGSAIVVEVHDSNGKLVTTGDAASVSVHLSTASGGGILGGVTTVQASGGSAQFASVTFERIGSIVLHADGDDAVQAVSSAVTVSAVAYTTLERKVGPEDGHGIIDGAATVARVSNPQSAATDGTYLYFTELDAALVRRMNLATGQVTTIGGQAFVPGSSDSPARFNGPSAVAVSGQTLYIADAYNSTIRRMNINGGGFSVNTFAGKAGVPGDTSDADPTKTRFTTPTGLAVSGTNLFVADNANGNVKSLALSNGATTKLTDLDYPYGLVYASPSDTLYATSNGFLMEINPTSGVSSQIIEADGCTTLAMQADNTNVYVNVWDAIFGVTVATPDTDYVTGDANADDQLYNDGIFDNALFGWPSGMLTVGTKLYVVDSDNAAIRVADLSAHTVSTIVGISGSGKDIVDDSGDAARISDPHALVSDGTYLYLADSCMIRKVDRSSGAISRFVGSADDAQCGLANGDAGESRFGTITDLATDGTTIFVADPDNNVIRSVDIATGAVDTFAGSGAANVLDGVGLNAHFQSAIELVYDSGWLYTSDDNTIRSINVGTRQVTTIAGTAGNDDCDTCASCRFPTATGSDAVFDAPLGLTATGGKIYFVESDCAIVREFDPATNGVRDVAGLSTDYATLGQPGPGAEVMFAGETLGKLGSDGRYLYMTSFTTGLVRRIDTQNDFQVDNWLGSYLDPRELNGPLAGARVTREGGVYAGFGELWFVGPINMHVAK